MSSEPPVSYMAGLIVALLIGWWLRGKFEARRAEAAYRRGHLRGVLDVRKGQFTPTREEVVA